MIKNLLKITFKTFVLFWILILPLNLIFIGTFITKPVEAAYNASCSEVV
jgi:hypothetical protein